jgi:integrase
MALTNTKITNTKPAARPLKLPDGGGLYLEVRPSGAKLWRYRYRIAGRENVFVIGEFFSDSKRAGHVSLEGARAARDAARVLVRRGVHPAHARQETLRSQIERNADTFKVVALEWMTTKSAKWGDTYAAQVRRVFDTDVFPHIGTLPISTVTAAQILEIMRRVEARGAVTFAHLIRQWTSAIFRHAVTTLRAQTDPAAALKGAIERKGTQHSRSLEKGELGAVLNRLDTYGGEQITKIAIRLIALTFVRTVELRAAEWTEFDLDAAIWRIPGARMKMEQEHIVPLSRQAVMLLRELHELTGGGRYLFPNRRRKGACMTSTTINRALERMRFNGEGTIGFSGHGFRSTASTMLNEAGFNPDAIERQLAHQEPNKTRRSYNHAKYLNEREQMMQAWADMVDRIVTPTAALSPTSALETTCESSALDLVS